MLARLHPIFTYHNDLFLEAIMEEPTLGLIVSLVSSVLTALISVVVFLPILLMFSWRLPNDQAPGFKLRTFVANQPTKNGQSAY